MSLTYPDFQKIDIRTGTIIKAEIFTNAHKPAYKLQIDFGALGILKSSAQITELYKLEDLPGKKVLAVVNFPPKQIADFMSECLILGAVDNEGKVTLLTTERHTANGLRVS